MHSMHIIASQKLGGAENFYTRLVHALHAEGQKVSSVNRRGSLIGPQLPPEIPQHRTLMLGRHDLLTRWHIRHFIQREQPDIVQTYMSRATGLTHVPRRSSSIHIARLGGFYKLKYFRHADHWVGNTKSICDYLVRNGLPHERVHFISNFVDESRSILPEEIQEARRIAAMPPDALAVIALGRFTHNKGFDVLIEAFSRLPPELQGRPLHLLLLGDGSLTPALHQQVEQLGLASRIHWAGWQTHAAPFFMLADVFVCPSRHEPLGNVILEAWAHGVPAISTATDGGRELITPNKDGLLVPIDDAKALAHTMQTLLIDDSGRRRLAEEGSRTLLARHGRATIVNAYNMLYQHVASSPRQP